MRNLLLAAVLAAALPAAASQKEKEPPPGNIIVTINPAAPISFQIWAEEFFQSLLKDWARDGRLAKTAAQKRRHEESLQSVRDIIDHTQKLIERRQAWARADFQIGMALRLQEQINTRLGPGQLRAQEQFATVHALKAGVDEPEFAQLREQLFSALLIAAGRTADVDGKGVVADVTSWAQDTTFTSSSRGEPEQILSREQIILIAKALDPTWQP